MLGDKRWNNYKEVARKGSLSGNGIPPYPDCSGGYTNLHVIK